MSVQRRSAWFVLSVAVLASALGACGGAPLTVLAPIEIRPPLEAALSRLPGSGRPEVRFVPAAGIAAAARDGGADVVIALGTDSLRASPAVDGEGEVLLYADTIVLAVLPSDETQIQSPQQILLARPGCLATPDPHGSETAGIVWDCLVRQYPTEVLDGIVRTYPTGADALGGLRRGDCPRAVSTRTESHRDGVRVAYTFGPEQCAPILVRGYIGSATRREKAGRALLRHLLGRDGGACFEEQGWVVMRQGIAR